MFKIFASWKRYNANPRNKRTGDCVKRSISLAYKKDYNQVASDLNAIKNRLGYNVFNVSPVYQNYIGNQGYVRRGPWRDFLDKETTVDEFCKEHPTGTWLVETKKPGKDRIDHILCIIDGDYFDSWDSGNQIIGGTIVEVASEQSSDVLSDAEIDQFKQELIQEVVVMMDPYVKKLVDKFPVPAQVSTTRYSDLNLTHVKFSWQVKFDYNYLENLAVDDSATYNSLYYTVKQPATIAVRAGVNLRMPLEDQRSKMIEKIRVDAREAFYQLRVELQEAIKQVEIRRQLKEQGSSYYGDRSLLIKLPSWVLPLAQWGSVDLNASYDRYRLEIHALPDDYRKDKDLIVEFRADTLSELRQNLEDYRTKFSRVDYDY